MKNARDPPKPPIGKGHAEAWLRQGLKELRQALYPDSNVAAPPEYGLYGTRTPGEVADAREPKERDGNEEPRSILKDRVDEGKETPEARDVRGRESRELERE